MNALPSEPQKTNPEAPIEVPKPVIDLSIYVMPSFATLTVSDLDRSGRWYVEGLGFALLASVPGPSGEVALIHLRRWRYQDLLLVPARHPLPQPAAERGIRLTFSAHGKDLDALVASARATGGGSVEGPTATPWNTLDVLARDPDGYEVVFTSTLPPHLHDPAFASRMEQVKQQVLEVSQNERQLKPTGDEKPRHQ
jgi:catechol 2,3-dioxygenase-like lactoylglutathione lyase family enzyme